MIREISWRRVGLVLAALAAAFASGRYLTPKRVEVKTQTVYQDRVVEKRVEVQSEAKERIVYRDRTVVKHADGTIEQRDVTRTDNSDATQDAKSDTATHETVKVVTEEKTVDRPVKSDWFISAGVGVPLSGAPFVTGEIARRVLGPIYLGAWASVDVHGQNPIGGLSVGVSF